ncbi:MAG: guanitoxin biosynthesis MBL fold metallo-hydrolase GntH [Planctomycetota bacterium]|jgi:ribonuclease Z
MKKIISISSVVLVLVGIVIGLVISQSGNRLVQDAKAAGGKVESPTGVAPDRTVYYPGTEELRPDEMRVVALGTGMPTVRPKQAAACFLVELGNGDKFLFDIGYGSVERLSAMKIPMDYIDKVFIGHLHMDHFGDLDALWIGGVKMNRTYPLRVWGPSGASPEMGTKYAIDGLRRMLNWDATTLKGLLDTRGEQVEVTEFDYKGVNEVIYEENGVVIRSIPAIHVTDGAVSFILEWNGLTFCYSSDTFPNKWWIEHTKGADISVHTGPFCHEAHVSPAVWEGHGYDEAASGGRIPLLQRPRHATCDA